MKTIIPHVLQDNLTMVSDAIAKIWEDIPTSMKTLDYFRFKKNYKKIFCQTHNNMQHAY